MPKTNAQNDISSSRNAEESTHCENEEEKSSQTPRILNIGNVRNSYILSEDEGQQLTGTNRMINKQEVEQASQVNISMPTEDDD